MNPLSAVWNWLLQTIEAGLALFHQGLDPLFGAHAWGWSIIALTVVIRVLLLPLAVKQTRSMRAMQKLSPEMQRIKKKYKVDRELMRKNPEKYKQQRQKMNEEVMALYKEHNVNPAASCLPLVLQAPIFFALFRVLNDATLEISGDTISQAPFYVIDQIGAAANSEIAGWGLVVGMIATMFISQKQMMARTQGEAEGIQAQQQKIMLYGMPVFLGFVAYRLPIGVLLYWVTTNLWQMGQQAVILREVAHEAEKEAESSTGKSGRSGKGGKGAPGGTAKSGPAKDRKAPPKRQAPEPPRPSPSDETPSGNGERPSGADSAEHLPRRKRRN